MTCGSSKLDWWCVAGPKAFGASSLDARKQRSPAFHAEITVWGCLLVVCILLCAAGAPTPDRRARFAVTVGPLGRLPCGAQAHLWVRKLATLRAAQTARTHRPCGPNQVGLALLSATEALARRSGAGALEKSPAKLLDLHNYRYIALKALIAL